MVARSNAEERHTLWLLCIEGAGGPEAPDKNIQNQRSQLIMNISPEQAIAFLSKLMNGGSALCVTVERPGDIRLMSCGIIHGVSTKEFLFSWDSGGLAVSLVGAHFDFFDHSTGPPPFESPSFSKSISLLLIRSPLGHVGAVYEMPNSETGPLDDWSDLIQ